MRTGLAWVLGLLAAVPVQAAAVELRSTELRTAGDSPRTVALDFRLGSYKPRIDDQFEGGGDTGPQKPYAAIFDDQSDVLFLLGLEYYLVRDYGTLSIGPSFGFWSVEGKGISEGDASDDTKLTIYPLLLQVSYKLDIWEDIVPLVPVVRFGLDYYVWEVLDGKGDTARFAPGQEAFGGTWGWHYTLGLYVLLDFLADEMAADFDRDAGVNSSYFTIEYHSATVNDFGSADSFRLGDDTVLFGLALDI